MGSVTLPESPTHGRVFHGCGGYVYACSVGPQPPGCTLPHLDSTSGTNTMGYLCPHGGSVKDWLAEGVSSLSSAQGHAWHREGTE